MILVTGATGAFGRPLVRELARRGVDVLAMARREPATLPRGVRFVAGDVADPAAVRAAMRDVDAVVHLAWVVSSARDKEATARINLEGTRTVLDAVGELGPKLVFASSILAYGSAEGHPSRFREDEPLNPPSALDYGVHKKIVEEWIAERDLRAVVVRPTAVLDRWVRNNVSDIFAAPALFGIEGDDLRWQLAHTEDVVRFLADAALDDRRGTVNLAADDDLSLEEVGEVLGKPVRRVSERALMAGASLLWRLRLSEVDPAGAAVLRLFPVADTTRLADEWKFRCAWTTREILLDARRTLRQYVAIGSVRRNRPTTLAYPPCDAELDLSAAPGHTLVEGTAPELAGQFDDLVDPSFGTFTRTNVGEALPGPLTPLTLELQSRGLKFGCAVLADLYSLPEPLRHESAARLAAVYAHNVWINVDLGRETAKALPGGRPEVVDEEYLGIAAPPGPARPTWAEIRAGLRMAPGLAGVLRGWRREIAWRQAETERLTMAPDDLEALSDERLAARLQLLFDSTVDALVMVVFANSVGGAASSLARELGGATAARVGSDVLASAGPLTLVRRAADAMRTGATAEVERLTGDLVRRHGHRGPGEMELANEVFADRPDLVSRAIEEAATRHPLGDDTGAIPATTPRATEPQVSQDWRLRLAAVTVRQREEVRDCQLRLLHQYRLAVRERARRLVAAAVLPDPDDVWYLTLGEVLHPPRDAAARVQARRAERERLASYRLPSMFEGRLEPLPPSAVGRADPGTVLSGLAAAPGVARGTVRLVRDPADSVGSGEILVTHVTDIGYTPLFAAAAAVVTDVGGMMSHTAVVAREFGIPAVVNVGDATIRLADGQVVEVDGTAGTVTVL